MVESSSPLQNYPAIHTAVCEGLINPLGIDESKPVFSWIPEVVQRAFRIVVYDGSDESAGSICWDSSWIESAVTRMEYGGDLLSSFTRYTYKIFVRDSSNELWESEDGLWFETALLSDKKWRADWIEAPVIVYDNAPIFLKAVPVEKEIREARIYVSGLGYYELRINSKKIGDHVLDPAWTDYSKRIFYVTYDVTDVFCMGENVIGVMVGSGRYRNPVVTLMCRIRYENGEVEEFFTDRSWIWVEKSPVLSNNIYHGEEFDARIRIPGWDTRDLSGHPDIPGNSGNSDYQPEKQSPQDSFSAEIYGKAIVTESPGGKMCSQSIEPIRVIHDILPVSEYRPESRKNLIVWEFDQNFAGWIKLSVKGVRGTKLTIQYSEARKADGTIEPKMNREAKSTDSYILHGFGVEEWEPRFTYHGFRFVQISFSEEPEELSITGRFVRSDVRSSGFFQSDNRLINRIQDACAWTEGNNLHSVPTDCPQRGERLGWLNDVTVRAEESLYNYNLSLFYTKWIDDIADTQGEKTGAISDIAPYDSYNTHNYGNRPADPVSSSYIIIPWLLYQFYADRRVVGRNFQGMVRWQDFLVSQSDDYILEYSYYGDWASPEAYTIPGSIGASAVSAITPGSLMSTGYLYLNAGLLSRMAGILDLPEVCLHYKKQAAAIGERFHEKFFNRENNYYAQGSQASQVFPLYLGIVPPDVKQHVLRHLIRDIKSKDFHLSTGNLCTKYILEVLSDEGYVDIAWELAVQTTYPGWGYMMEHGATTIWERWEYVIGEGMNSHNHPMYATISCWFYKYLAGIRPVEEFPGFQKVLIKPFTPAGLNSARAEFHSSRGTVASSWERVGEYGVEYTIKIPRSSEARIELPVSEGPGAGQCVIKRVDENGVETSLPDADSRICMEKEGRRVVINLEGGLYRIVVR